MNKQKILIIGDSFAADWSVKYDDYPGWPNMLAENYKVTNLAQAGVGEYKVFKQLTSVDTLDKFDIVIVSHPSPYRVYTRNHPTHCNDLLHQNADLMLNDLIYHSKKFKNLLNLSLKSGIQYFKYHEDNEHLEMIYVLLREKINQILKNSKVIVISNLPHLRNFITEKLVLDYSDLYATAHGLINHMSKESNIKIYQDLKNCIQQINLTPRKERKYHGQA